MWNGNVSGSVFGQEQLDEPKKDVNVFPWEASDSEGSFVLTSSGRYGAQWQRTWDVRDHPNGGLK
jgi:hypothetical protein